MLAKRVVAHAASARLFFTDMDFSLSTNWHSSRCETGEEVVDQALGLGFDSIELSYRLTPEQLDGIRRRVDSGAVRISSIHSPCPLPSPEASPSPEPFSLTALEEEERQKACGLLVAALNAAVDFGAPVVVAHAGHVSMSGLTDRWVAIREAERRPGFIQRFLLNRKMKQRQEKSTAHMDALRRSLSEILPFFDDAKVVLALENLPYWEGIPSETEMETLHREFNTPSLRYWHDIGHGQVRENICVGGHLEWVRRLMPIIAGCHIHDVIGITKDHLAPGQGGIDFGAFACLSSESIAHVFEPSPMVDREALAEGLALVRRAWRG